MARCIYNEGTVKTPKICQMLAAEGMALCPRHEAMDAHKRAIAEQKEQNKASQKRKAGQR